MSDAGNTHLLLKISSDIGEMKGLMQGIDNKLDAHISDDKDNHKELDKRIAKVETQGTVSKVKISIAASAIGIAGAGVIEWFLNTLHIGNR